jgi:class 3 adenylate cyclase/DNA-binding transcriptional ArsR family regulator
VRCSGCETENPISSRFCSNCGKPVALRCPGCNAEVLRNARFCSQCGAPLIPASATSANSGSPPVVHAAATAADGERRHLTVLFCDLAGSTAISAGLDPEDWRAAVAAYHRAAATAITRFGGHVAKYLGDGVMAFFGYPEAHDNDAERAVRAGLAILGALAALNESSAHPRLAARIGIDSGAVVVGAGAGKDADVFGDTPNIAARVEAAAEPGTVLVSASTHRLISGMFVVEDCGAQVLKGIEQPLHLYRIVRASGVRGRFEAAAARGLTPFVGRDDELRTLAHRWERARDGEGQVALIIGEAGIGKSRLVHRFHEAIAGTPHTWLDAGAGAFYQNTPFYPVTEMLRQFIGDTTAAAQVTQLETRLNAAGLKPVEALPLIAPLLNLTLPTEYPPSPLPPDQQRRRLLATLVEWVLGSSRSQPLIIATEDLHWADPSTLELIQLLVEQGNAAPLMLLYTARPEFRPSWPQRSHHAQITLNRLNARDIRTMVAQVAAQKALADETVTAVVERTGGVPLFVEELTRSLLESGDAKLTGRTIPATLHDSLMARLDRLGPAKEVIQIGAVLGSEFSYELLHAVHPLSEDALQRHLRALTDAELLYVRGLAPDAIYQFKHALIRDAAYEALLKSRRRELHRLVADTIDSRFPTLKETHPEILAQHWTVAGETEPAISAWTKAAEHDYSRRAYREADQHYREALQLLQTLPESPDRDRHELALQISMGNVMGATRAWSAAETAEAYARARILAARDANADSLQIFNGLWVAAITRGELHAALALADQLLEIAEGIGSPAALAIAHSSQGQSRHLLGDLAGAREHLVKAIAYYRADDFRGNVFDPGIAAMGWAGPNEWHLGYHDRALRYTQEARALANDQNSPFSLALAVSLSSQVHGLGRDYKLSLESIEEAMRLGNASGFPIWNAIGKIVGAWARAQIGVAAGATDRIEEGLAELNAMEYRELSTMFHTLLAETQALRSVQEALVTIEQTLQADPDELLHRPNALILRGQLRLRSEAACNPRSEFAERDLREAIALAQSMSAKSWELRATMSLAQLLRDTSRGDEARTLLTEIYNWFTEGFDTPDLKDAKALLDELGQAE